MDGGQDGGARDGGRRDGGMQMGGDDGGYGLTARLPNATCRLDGTPDGLPDMKVQPAFPNLNFSSPVLLTYAPGDSSRLFVVEQTGRIRVFPNRPDAAPSDVKVFLDVSTKIHYGGEEGLLALAFHPKYAQNRYFYIYYTLGSPQPSVLVRYQTRENDPNSADPMSATVLLQIPQPYANHNGGTLAFGPDGYLYLTTGDGGSGGDPQNHAQDLSSLLGKVLRIDVDNAGGALPYGIPDDNPFVGADGGAARGEVWAYGMRNPWRCSFDRVTELLWCGDVGQDTYEEVDIITRGSNYGWRLMEGTHCYNPPTNCNPGTLTLPIIDYSHTVGGCAITGGFVYRGSLLPDLYGAYIYGDYCSGNIWALRYDGAHVTESHLLVSQSGLNISSFGEDSAGELYIVNLGGTLHQLARQSGMGTVFPTTLSATGCFSNVLTREPAPSLVPYEVNSPLWADGTDKRRFLVLPDGTTIGYKDSGAWDLPDGTILVKEFLVDLETGNPATQRAIETRFLVKRNGTWQGYTYEWNDEQTDAFLLSGSATKTFTLTDPQSPGAITTYTHYLPSRADCARCHTPVSGGALGLHTGQINRPHDYDGVVDNQLRAMDHIGLFGLDGLPDVPAQLPRFPDPADVAVPLEGRARSYLQGNCAQCHQPGGPTAASIDLRYETPLALTNTCDAVPVSGDLGVAGSRILVPGAPDQSVLWLRDSRRGTGQMPPLATNAVDPLGSELVRDWILSLSSCP
jgi:uncharacterized repeat protein (TIGR03806 family)